MGKALAEEKVTFITVLPLRGVGHILEGGKKREDLANGYALVDRESLPELGQFKEEYMTKIVSSSEWSHIRHAPVYLQVSYVCALQNDIEGVETEGSEYCGEKIDRFLLALNINERLWSFRPHIRLSWFEKDVPLSRQNVRVRQYFPLSTFEGKLNLEDFRQAAGLTTTIDEVYSDIDEEREKYPALKTAFSSIKLGMYAFNTSMRLLQEAIALEALYSTDATEVTHRIATTYALLLGSTLEERKRLYDEAKDLYGIRSRVIHGSGRRVTKEEFRRIEQLSRKLLRHVLTEGILPKFRTRASQREFLLNLALGGF
jgi:hypothetical protein